MIGAWAGTTTSCKMPSLFSPGGKRIDSGAQTRAWRGADDLGPAGDHAGLDEAEAAEGGAANLGHEIGNRARRAAARALEAGAACAAVLA